MNFLSTVSLADRGRPYPPPSEMLFGSNTEWSAGVLSGWNSLESSSWTLIYRLFRISSWREIWPLLILLLYLLPSSSIAFCVAISFFYFSARCLKINLPATIPMRSMRPTPTATATIVMIVSVDRLSFSTPWRLLKLFRETWFISLKVMSLWC